MRLRVVAFAVLVAALSLASSFLPATVAAKAPVSKTGVTYLPTVPLTIETASGTRQLQIEVARTSAEQERGLMYRHSLPKDGGMIFPMEPVRVATFWMKNTLIPLDMVFIRTDGTIARITTAKALSLDIDDSGEPVGAVLELAGGKAAALGIAVNDHVTWQDVGR